MLEVLRMARREGAFEGDWLSDLAAGLRERLDQILQQHVGSLEAKNAWQKETQAALYPVGFVAAG